MLKSLDLVVNCLGQMPVLVLVFLWNLEPVCKLLPIPSSSSCFLFIFNIISESGRIALEAVPWIFWFSFLRVLKSLDFSR